MPNRRVKRKSADAGVSSVPLTEAKGESCARYVPNFSKKRRRCLSKAETTGNGSEKIPTTASTDPQNDTNEINLPSFLERRCEEARTDQKNTAQQWYVKNDKSDLPQQVASTKDSESICKKTEIAMKVTKRSGKGTASKKVTKAASKTLQGTKELADINPTDELELNIDLYSINSICLDQVMHDEKDVFQSEKDSDITYESLSTTGENIDTLEKWRHSTSLTDGRKSEHCSIKNGGKIQNSSKITTAQLLERFKFISKEEQSAAATVMIEGNGNVGLRERTDPNCTDPRQTVEDTAHHNEKEHHTFSEVVKNDFSTSDETDKNMKEIGEEMSTIGNTNQHSSTRMSLKEFSANESHYFYPLLPTSENEPECPNASSKELERCKEITTNDLQATAGAESVNEDFKHGSVEFRKANEDLQEVIIEVESNFQINQQCFEIQQRDLNTRPKYCENAITVTRGTEEETNIQMMYDKHKLGLLKKNTRNLESVSIAEDTEIEETKFIGTSSDSRVITSSECPVPEFYTTCSIPSIEEQSCKSETVANIPKDNISSNRYEEACHKTAEYYENDPEEQQNRTVITESLKINESHIEDDLSNHSISSQKCTDRLKLRMSEGDYVDISDLHEKDNAYYLSPEPCASLEKCYSETGNTTDRKNLLLKDEMHSSVLHKCQRTIAVCDNEDLRGNVCTSDVLHVTSSNVLNNAGSCSDKDDSILTIPSKTVCLSHSIEDGSTNLCQQLAITETAINELKVSFANIFLNSEEQARYARENNTNDVLFDDSDKHITPVTVCKQNANNSCPLREEEENLLYSECADKKAKNAHSGNLDLSDCLDEDDIQSQESKSEEAKLPNVCGRELFGLPHQTSTQIQNAFSQTCLLTNETSGICTLQDGLEGSDIAKALTSGLRHCQTDEKDYDSSPQEITVPNSLPTTRKSEEICPDNFMKEEDAISDDIKIKYGHGDSPLLTEANCASSDPKDKLEKIQVTRVRRNETNTDSALNGAISKDIHNSFAPSTISTEMPEDQVCESMAFTFLKEQTIEDLQQEKTLTRKRSKDFISSEGANDGDVSHITHPTVVTSENASEDLDSMLLEDIKGVVVQSVLENGNTGQISSKTNIENRPEMGADKILCANNFLVPQQGTVTDVSTTGIGKGQLPYKTESVINVSPSYSSSLLFKNREFIHNIKNPDVCWDREDTVIGDTVKKYRVPRGSSGSKDWHTLQCGIIYRPDGENFFSSEKAEEESDSYDEDEELFIESAFSHQTNSGLSVTAGIFHNTGNMDKDCDDLKTKTEENETNKRALSKTADDNHSRSIFRWQLEERYPESSSSTVHRIDNTIREPKFTAEARENSEEPMKNLKPVSGSVLSSPEVTPRCHTPQKTDDEVDDRGCKEDTSPICDFHDNALKPVSESAYEQFEEEFDDDFELTASQLSRMDADVLKETTATSDSIGNNAGAEEVTSCLTETFEHSIILEILNRLRSIDDKVTNLTESIRRLQYGD